MTTNAELEAHFPGLKSSKYSVTSPPTDDYNCIALAAGDRIKWWWPEPNRYWPPGVPRAATVDAFEQAFRTLGFTRCAGGEYEPNKDKVVLFVDEDGVPTHMARQRRGQWHSKLGQAVDIVHDLSALEGQSYGVVHAFFSRPTNKKQDRSKAKNERRKAAGRR